MEEEQVIPAQETPEAAQETPQKEGSSGKMIAIIIGLILFTLLIGGGAYFLGKQSGGSTTNQASPTPYQIFSPTPTSELQEPPSTTVSGTLTPTKKPTPTPTPSSKTKIISSSASLDGFRSSNGGGNSTLDIRAGRNVNLVTRGFVSFDLSDIPSGATIKKATLRLYQAKIVGDPYGAGGTLKIDHLVYGDSLDDADYAVAALSSSFATLTNNAVVEWKDVDVTDSLKDDIANARSMGQFRIHFASENTGGDVIGDFTYFESEDNSESSGNTPQLVVEYY